MKKIKLLILLFSCGILSSTYAADTTKATFNVNKPFNVVNARIHANLQRCVTKQAGFFNSGRKLVMDDLDTADIYHVKEYQLTGEIIGDLGTIVVSGEQGKTVIAVTNQPNLIGKDLHLIESIKNWINGNNKCIPNTGGILS